jgi:hypothetical protein
MLSQTSLRFPRLFTAAIAAVFLSVPMAAFADTASPDEIQISPQELNQDSELVPFRVSDAFKIILAGYKQQIDETQADASLSPDEKVKIIERLRYHAMDTLLLHEQVVNIAPVVFALTINLGAEIPFPVTRKLLRYGYLNAQLTGGVTIAMTRPRGTESVGLHNFVLGASTLAGPTISILPPATETPASTGLKTIGGVSLIVPLEENLPPLRLGDLQGWYFGGAVDLSPNITALGAGVAHYHFGLYARPNGFHIPRAGLIFVFRGSGSQGKAHLEKAEALYFGTLAATDGSGLRSPIPYLFNYSTSVHSDPVREEELRKQMPTPDEVRSALEKTSASYAADSNVP